MMLALVCCSALMADVPPGPPAGARREYEEARGRAGRSPEAQVRLALWCESRGLTAERLHHLALAVLADPTNATAQGLMGLASYQGRFRRPEAIAEKAATIPALAEYEARRREAPYTAGGQWALGVWAEERGLKDQARAHFTAVTRLEPGRDLAWQRLGYRRRGGRWITDAQLAAEKAEADAQARADKAWRPALEQARAMLDRPAQRAEAEATLAAVTDPRALPSILAAFAAGRRPDHARAVQLLGQVDSPAGSRALAALAVTSKSADARRSALETLKGRDPRDFVKLWIGLIREPIRYEVRPVGGPGSAGELFVEGSRANVRRVYAPPTAPAAPVLPGMTMEFDDDGLPVLVGDLGSSTEVDGGIPGASIPGLGAALDRYLPGRGPGGHGQALAAAALLESTPLYEVTTRKEQVRVPIGRMRAEARQSADAARRQLADDVAAIERANRSTRRSSEPALVALREVTGKDLGADVAAWNRWWTDALGYAPEPAATASPPTIVENVPIAYSPQAAPSVVASTTTEILPIPKSGPALVNAPASNFKYVHCSCFAAGTPVRTVRGDRAIESIRPGDLVLVQDPGTGGLSYQPVVAAYHNPPSPTLRVRLGGEATVATGIHRFWKAGRGWTMARDLRPGDALRVVGGVARVESVEPEKTQPVFNLEVAEGHSFFVGGLGALVHDNSTIEPTPEPFDLAVAPPTAR